jgi:hypothetical protein
MQIPEGAVFEKVSVDAIEATAATQVRVRIDRSMVDQYTEDFQNGAAFPPLVCFREENSERIVLADGFHRHRAAINAGRDTIGCIIHAGNLHDALIYALGSNAEHGFRRTNKDKRHAVEMALKDPMLSTKTNREIADICRVAESTVRKILNEQMASDDDAHGIDDENGSQDNSDKVKENDGSDVRDSGVKLTQEQVETDEVREACKMISVLPYPGEQGLERLVLDEDLVADCEYASSWLAALVIAYRNREQSDD